MDRKQFINTSLLSLSLLAVPKALIAGPKNKYPKGFDRLLYSYYDDKNNFGAGLWANLNGPVNDISLDVKNGNIEIIMSKVINKSKNGTGEIESIYSWRKFSDYSWVMRYKKYEPYIDHINYLLEECRRKAK